MGFLLVKFQKKKQLAQVLRNLIVVKRSKDFSVFFWTKIFS